MERPSNLSSDPTHKSASQNEQPLTASAYSEGNNEASVKAIAQRSLRFRYPLVSQKRLRTLGPARRVLVTDTERDNILPKISEEENSASPDQPASCEKDLVVASTECPRAADNPSQHIEREVSRLGQSNAYDGISGGNHEPQEHRKRKADMGRLGEDATISLTVNVGSSGRPNQNNADLMLIDNKCGYFGTGEVDSEGNIEKSMAEHNISVNSYQCNAYNDEANFNSANKKIDEASGSKCHLDQLEKLYNMPLRSDHPKPVVQVGQKKVHFANVDYSNRGDGAVFPNSSIMDMKHRQVHSAFDNHQKHLKSSSLVQLAKDDRNAPIMSSIQDESIQKVGRLHDSISSTIVSVDSKACEVAPDTGVENLSSHLNSLALTENQESGSLNNLGESCANHRPISNLTGVVGAPKNMFISKEVQITKTNVTVTTAQTAVSEQILKPRDNASSGIEVNNSIILSAPATLSCNLSAFGISNSTSVHCTSVLSTVSSVPNLGPCKGLVSATEKGVLGEPSRISKYSDPNTGADDSERHFNLNLCNSSASSASIFPCTSSAFACQSATSIQCTSGPLTSSSVGQGVNMSREQSATAKTNSGRNLTEEPSNARFQDPQAVMKIAEEKFPQEPHVTSMEIKDKNRVPEGPRCINQSIQQPSSEVNLEKTSTVTIKETGTGRKKHYDSDAFFRVNNKLYQKLGKIGSGGSSEVHKVISSDCSIYALKKIKLKGRDYSTAYGFCQEIDYLTRLRGKNYIIQLIDYEVTDKNLFRDVVGGKLGNKEARINEDAYIYMVLEYGEIDLAQMLLQKWKEMDAVRNQIDENWLRFYWQQILKAVNTIHEERIVHSDLKPANFLLVKGVLKLIDFGIAKAIQSDTTNIQRESQVGTLNYMSPEAFLCNDEDENGNIIKCGRPSDIWSLGCILYQMVYGRTPFADFKTFWAKYKEITNKDHKITYGPVSNPALLDIMKKCLAWKRNERLRIPQLLEHPFLQPPAPSLMLTQEERHCSALVEISTSYESDVEICRLCEKLQEQIRKLSKQSDR